MTTPKKAEIAARRKRVSGLRENGLSFADIGTQLGVSKETARKDAQAVNGNGHKNFHLVDLPVVADSTPSWGSLASEAIERLREASDAGSVSASKELAKLALNYEREGHQRRCEEEHITSVYFVESMNRFTGEFVKQMQGPLIVELAHLLGGKKHTALITGVVDSHLEAVRATVNSWGLGAGA